MMRTVLAAVWVLLLMYLTGVVFLILEAREKADMFLPGEAAHQVWSAVSFLALVGLAHIAAGAVCGAVSWLLAVWVWPRQRFRGPAVFLFLTFCYVFLRDLVKRPVFYEPILYPASTLTRSAMDLVTGTFSPAALDAAALLGVSITLLAGVLERRDKRAFRVRLAAVAGIVALVWASVITVTAIREKPAGLGRAVRAGGRPGQGINLVFLGSDSLRADRLAALGSKRKVLPNIDALAREGVVFRDVFVPLARTLPSMASLFTGCDPHTHGLRHMFPPRHRRTVRLPTLPAILRKHGYASEVVTDYAGEMFKMVDLGFDRVDGPRPFSLTSVIQHRILDHTPGFLPFFNNPAGHLLFPVLGFLPANADPDWLADRLLGRLEALDGGRPFLLTGFFSTNHTPYAAPWPGYKRFSDPSYEGPNKYAYFVRSLAMMDQLEVSLPPAEVNQIRALYDGACSMVDAAIGRVVRDIRRRGLWHRTLLIIFSDHGEHLYEAGNTTDHGKWFRGDEANRIPLIIAGGPLEVRGKVVEGVVRSIDVLPTLLGLLGLAGPDTMEGVDVGPRIRGDETGTQAAFAETGIWLDGASTFQGVEDALIYPSIDKLLTLEDGDLLVLRDRFNDDVEKAKHRCIRTEEWKLVYIPTRTGFRVELYDVVKDPANTHNLAAAQPEVVRRLSRRLRRWMLRDPGKHFNKAGHLVPRYCYYE